MEENELKRFCNSMVEFTDVSRAGFTEVFKQVSDQRELLLKQGQVILIQKEKIARLQWGFLTVSVAGSALLIGLLLKGLI